MARTVPDRPPPRVLALLRDAGALPAAALLAGLSMLNALTEGIGLVLLVPMLGLLGGAGGGTDGIGRALGWLGVAPTLEALLVLFVVLVVLRALLGAARDLAGFAVEARAVDWLRLRAWRALVHCDWRHLSALPHGAAASMLITNVDRVGRGLFSLVGVFTTGTTLLALGGAAILVAPGLSAGAGLAGLAIWAAHRGMRARARLLGEAIGDTYRDIHGQLGEGLGAMRIIKSFGGEDASSARIAGAFRALRAGQLGFVRDQGMARAAFQGAGAVALAALVWLALRRWEIGAAAILPTVALFARALPLLGTVQERAQDWAYNRPALAEALALIATPKPPRKRHPAPARRHR